MPRIKKQSIKNENPTEKVIQKRQSNSTNRDNFKNKLIAANGKENFPTSKSNLNKLDIPNQNKIKKEPEPQIKKEKEPEVKIKKEKELEVKIKNEKDPKIIIERLPKINKEK